MRASENGTAGLGPGATGVTGVAGAAPVAVMSRERADLLAALVMHDGLVTLDVLATDTGSHRSTVREHLIGLLDDGLVVREKLPTGGRGRPPWGYRAVVADGSGRHTTSSGMLDSLAGALAGLGPAGEEAAARAGVAWGHALAGGAAPGSDPDAALEEALAGEGFAPERVPGAGQRWRLTQCPALDQAREHPEVICVMHHRMVTGLLDGVGAPPADVILEPFAEHGACALEVR